MINTDLPPILQRC